MRPLPCLVLSLLTLHGCAAPPDPAPESPAPVGQAPQEPVLPRAEVPDAAPTLILRAQPLPVENVAVSADAARILTGGWEGTTLWHARAGEVLRLPATALGLDLGADGTLAVIGGNDGSAGIYDTRSGRELQRVGDAMVEAEGFSDDPVRARFAPDARTVLLSSEQGLTLWDATTGRQIRRLEGHGYPGVAGFTFAPDGRRILTSGFDGTIRLWDIRTREELHRLGHGGAATFVADGRQAVTAFGDGTLRVWDSGTGMLLRRVPNPAQERVTSLHPLSDPARILAVHGDAGTATVRDLDTGEVLARFGGDNTFIIAAAPVPDQRLLLTGGGREGALLWDVEGGRQVARLLSFPDGTWAVIAPGGEYDASGDGRNPNLEWVRDGQRIPSARVRDGFYRPGLLQRILLPSLLDGG